jgi:hypothetical protein
MGGSSSTKVEDEASPLIYAHLHYSFDSVFYFMLSCFILIYVTISFENRFVLHLCPTSMRSNPEVHGMVGMS